MALDFVSLTKISPSFPVESTVRVERTNKIEYQRREDTMSKAHERHLTPQPCLCPLFSREFALPPYFSY